jgi:hypothetical protein
VLSGALGHVVYLGRASDDAADRRLARSLRRPSSLARRGVRLDARIRARSSQVRAMIDALRLLDLRSYARSREDAHASSWVRSARHESRASLAWSRRVDRSRSVSRVQDYPECWSKITAYPDH